MNTVAVITLLGVASGFAGLFVWLGALRIVRSANFGATERLPSAPIRGADNAIRSAEVKYHNEAIYRDFEYFFKASAAMLGGAAFLLVQTRTKELAASIGILIELTAVFQVAVAIAASIFIFMHQKSKIERWTQRFTLPASFWWQETWMIFVMCFVSGAYAFAVVPLILPAQA